MWPLSHCTALTFLLKEAGPASLWWLRIAGVPTPVRWGHCQVQLGHLGLRSPPDNGRGSAGLAVERPQCGDAGQSGVGWGVPSQVGQEDHVKFHPAAQNGLRLHTSELLISGIFHSTFLDQG